MCVLLVEDEPLIRELMTETLRDAGYETIDVEDGAGACAVVLDPPKPLSILVTDFHMPGNMDGAQVAARARSVLPGLPVVIVSGRPEVFQSTWQHALGYTLMKKPYRPSELVRLVRSLTAGSNGVRAGA